MVVILAACQKKNGNVKERKGKKMRKAKKKVERDDYWKEYEEACEEVEVETVSGESSEFAINWTRRSKTATVFFPSGSRMASKLRRLAEKYPDEIEIVHENNDGSIIGHVPVKAIKLSIIKQSMSDERREELKERMSRAQEAKFEKKIERKRLQVKRRVK